MPQIRNHDSIKMPKASTGRWGPGVCREWELDRHGRVPTPTRAGLVLWVLHLGMGLAFQMLHFKGQRQICVPIIGVQRRQ